MGKRRDGRGKEERRKSNNIVTSPFLLFLPFLPSCPPSYSFVPVPSFPFVFSSLFFLPPDIM
jgi:hypothetical protein